LTDLNLMDNEITKINGLDKLNKLENLYLGSNMIQAIEGLSGMKRLKILTLNNNSIEEIKGLEGLDRLMTLNMDNNKIAKIKGLDDLKQLKILSLDLNRISIIEGLDGLFNLNGLFLVDNKIKSTQGISKMKKLSIIRLGDNYLREFVHYEQLSQLTKLGLDGNDITDIPLSLMVYCPRLEEILIDTINLPPILETFLNRNKMNLENTKIYDDNENVHDASISQSLMESMYRIVQETPVCCDKDTMIAEIIKDNILNVETKDALIGYMAMCDIHVTLNITFTDLLFAVWGCIKNNENCDEIKRVLNTEMKDSLQKCFTGRMSRLLNCLNSFDPRVMIKIASADEIANVIMMIRNKYNDNVEEQKKEIVKELVDRGYGKDMIDAWVQYVE
jgi:Leucine-rich repeat (LRR) protein